MSGKKMLNDDIATEIKCFTKALPYIYIILYDDTVGIRKVNQTFFLDFSVYDFAVLLRKKNFVLINRSRETLGITYFFRLSKMEIDV